MAFDGVTWNEARPDNNDFANEIDDYMRDERIGVRSRMAHEHIWPSSQSATNQAGMHQFITFNGQTSAPVLVYGTTTQRAAIWCSSGSNDLLIEDSAGNSYILFRSGAGVVFFGATGSIGSIPYVTSGGSFSALTASTAGLALISNGANTAPSWQGIGALAGTWASGTAVGAAAQVTQDSFVIVQFETTETAKTTSTFKTDSNATPTTVRGKIQLDANDGPANQTISCIVKKNEYYLVETSGGTVVTTTYVIPIGA